MTLFLTKLSIRTLLSSVLAFLFISLHITAPASAAATMTPGISGPITVTTTVPALSTAADGVTVFDIGTNAGQYSVLSLNLQLVKKTAGPIPLPSWYWTTDAYKFINTPYLNTYCTSVSDCQKSGWLTLEVKRAGATVPFPVRYFAPQSGDNRIYIQLGANGVPPAGTVGLLKDDVVSVTLRDGYLNFPTDVNDYEFKVIFGVSRLGSGQGGPIGSGSSATAEPISVITPAAPTVVAAVGGAQVTPAVVSPTPANYLITASPQVGGVTKTCTVTPPSTSCTVNGLTLGENYTFTTQVFPVGGIASGISSASNSASPLEAPTVTSIAPSGGLTGGGELVTIKGTKFESGVAVKIGGFNCTNVALVSATELTCLTPASVIGAKNVQVINTNGASGWGIGIYTYRVANPPGTPTAPTLTVGAGLLTVGFTAPATGGAPVSYTATLSPGGKTCTALAPATTCDVADLDSKVSYTATYVAINADGSSTSSPTSASASPKKALPGTPVAPTVTAKNGSVSVKADPALMGGDVETLKITASPGGAFCVITLPAKSCDIAGLTNKTTYTFTVVATNESGNSAASLQTTAIPVDPNADVAPVEEDGDLSPAAISSGTGKTFTATNDKTFQLAWEKKNGKLTSRATGIYTGYIQAAATFTKSGKTYTCSTVFGTLKALPMKTAAQKTASMKSKTFTGKQFCIDKIKMDARTLAPKGGMTSANFKKIKSMNKTSSELAKEKLALAALKNFTGEVQIQVTRYRAWPTTMVNIGDHNSKGGKIPFLIRNTKVNLG
jgi:hypothetical protein